MRYVRLLGSIALWIGALLGVVAGAVWTGGRLDIIQPMIVISGSMEPGLMTGDLLIDRYVPADQVDVGDVLSLPSEATGKLVTHRVISIDPLDSDRAELFDVRFRGTNKSRPVLRACFHRGELWILDRMIEHGDCGDPAPAPNAPSGLDPQGVPDEAPGEGADEE